MMRYAARTMFTWDAPKQVDSLCGHRQIINEQFLYCYKTYNRSLDHVLIVQCSSGASVVGARGLSYKLQPY